MRYLLVLLGLLVSGTANAVECRETPDCKAMGYSTASDPNCKDDGYIFCPFDQAYKKCVNMNCEALGFTADDKSSWCADLITCKGNKDYTLCQTPCLADDEQTLLSLITSKKCKIVTLTNNITLTKALSTDVTLDGSGYTITTPLRVFLKDAKFQNIIFEKLHENAPVLEASGITYLENVTLKGTTDVASNYGLIKQQDSTVSSTVLSGKIALYATNQRIIAEALGIVFQNANVTIKGTQDIFATVNIRAENSSFEIESESALFLRTHFELQNSTFKAHSNGLFYHNTNGQDNLITLNEGSLVDLSFNVMNMDGLGAGFILNGTEQSPAKLILTYPTQWNNSLNDGTTTTISAQSTSDTLVLNGKTYRPKKPSNHKISEIPTATDDWETVL